MRFFLYFLMVATLLTPRLALAAGDFVEDSSSGSDSGDSTFDPFSDYSEFEEGSEEESDINFFHNGRFFSVGGAVGYQMFTDTYGQIYSPTFTYGIVISYFFSLRFALQASYMTADHAYKLNDGKTNTKYSGTMNLTHLALDFKYYINTQNVTRGLAPINPYVIAGISNHYRTVTVSGQPGYVRDTCYGVQGGLGVEFPILRGKMFLGGQVLYNYISFVNRGSTEVDNNGNAIGPVMNGDAINFLGLVGANF